MAPTTFHIFRHAEGEHQMRDFPPMKRDADLTENGRRQCAELCANLPPWAGRVKRVIASPMRRTLRTALISFAPILADGKVIEAIPEITEAGSRISGFGSDPDELIACFSANGEDRKINLSRLWAGWNPFDINSKFAYGADKVRARCAEARAELRQVAAETEAEAAREGNEEGAHVIVITHSVIAHFLTNDYEGIAETGLSISWDTNLLYRSFQFGSDPHRLIETPESRARVGLPAVSTPAEQEKGRERIEARMNRRQPIIEADVRKAAEAEAKAKAKAQL